MKNPEINEIEKKLKEPVPRSDIGFRIAKVDRNTRKALALPYLSSRALMDRLDDVFGIDGWFDEYEVLKNGVTCKLSIKLNGEFITKENAAQFTNIESLNESFSDALSQTAVKFGIGRYLNNLSDIYVDILESNPENHKNEVHLFQSDELSGWWEEPDLASLTMKDGKASESQSPQPDYSELTLPQKLEHLLNVQIITVKKHADYLKKLDDKTTGSGLLKYFEKQFDLLYNLQKLAKRNKISPDQRANIYKRIMSSKMADFTLIDNEFKVLEAA